MEKSMIDKSDIKKVVLASTTFLMSLLSIIDFSISRAFIRTIAKKKSIWRHENIFVFQPMRLVKRGKHA